MLLHVAGEHLRISISKIHGLIFALLVFLYAVHSQGG